MATHILDAMQEKYCIPAKHLGKFHLLFFHPGMDKLFNLIAREKPENLREMKEMLKFVTEARTTCQ